MAFYEFLEIILTFVLIGGLLRCVLLSVQMGALTINATQRKNTDDLFIAE